MSDSWSKEENQVVNTKTDDDETKPEVTNESSVPEKVPNSPLLPRTQKLNRRGFYQLNRTTEALTDKKSSDAKECKETIFKKDDTKESHQRIIKLGSLKTTSEKKVVLGNASTSSSIQRGSGIKRIPITMREDTESIATQPKKKHKPITWP